MRKETKHISMKINVLIILVSCLFMCNACSKDPLGMNIVHIQIKSNSDEPIRVYGTNDGGETGVVIKRNYESTFKSDSDGISIDVRCKDENTLITIKVWVNGKLKSNVSGNKYLSSGYIGL